MNPTLKKWLIIGGLSSSSFLTGLLAAILLIQFVAWLDDDILNQYCLYEQCPLKYDIVGGLSFVLIPLVSLLQGYLMYCFFNKIWHWDGKLAITS